MLFEWAPDMQKRFLRFVTGSDRVPVGGMAEMVNAFVEISLIGELLRRTRCFHLS